MNENSWKLQVAEMVPLTVQGHPSCVSASSQKQKFCCKDKAQVYRLLYETKMVFAILPNCDRQIAQSQKYTMTRAGGVAGALVSL